MKLKTENNKEISMNLKANSSGKPLTRLIKKKEKNI